MTTAFTGATRIIVARFASEISPKSNVLTTKVDSCLHVSNWAGMLVTARITVWASTTMMQYVWRNLPKLLTIFYQVEKTMALENGLHQRGWLGHRSNLPHHIMCQ